VSVSFQGLTPRELYPTTYASVAGAQSQPMARAPSATPSR
jgi:hypothetical protein